MVAGNHSHTWPCPLTASFSNNLSKTIICVPLPTCRRISCLQSKVLSVILCYSRMGIFRPISEPLNLVHKPEGNLNDLITLFSYDCLTSYLARRHFFHIRVCDLKKKSISFVYVRVFGIKTKYHSWEHIEWIIKVDVFCAIPNKLKTNRYWIHFTCHAHTLTLKMLSISCNFSFDIDFGLFHLLFRKNDKNAGVHRLLRQQVAIL